ncbi:Major Facilitator Superfamily [Emericellopsis cladophorae]|uniref:Major Facilitator Superfamily n=1 Tax=Emericellopsis cladophorae TaxID=2686198 RepID=A0A9P9Y501_9HYPO|nr:Major Facilitator Superfamily [Emericellopsis cladophorae]KAI6783654.1 Major Facilitator Superfamily [Emericellopsis cladophorae]
MATEHDRQSDPEKQSQQYASGEMESRTAQSPDKRATSSTRAEHHPSLPEADDGHDDESSSDEGGDQPSILDRVLSRVTSRSSVDPGPPPDGGMQAWSQCIAGHFVISNSWGFINSFGVWQDYLPTLLPERSDFEISFIGSLTVFLLFFLGTFTGRLADAGYFRPIFLLGSFFQLLGIFMTSLCTKYWHFMLAQGICIGIGNGLLFCPSLALVSTYFLKRRAVAIGLTAAGSVTGGLIFPIMARELLPRIGFPWTIRAIGLVQLASLAISNSLAKPRIRPRKTGPIVELAAFRELEYTFYVTGAFCFFWGVYFAFYYLARFSRDGLEKDPFSFDSSLNLLLVMNGVGLTGRIIPNFLADRFGAVNIFIPICGVTSLLSFCWIAVDTQGALYAWAVLYGIFAGGIQSLFPVALSFLTTDLRKLGVRMGMGFTIVSFAVLTGPPIAGSIIDSTGSYVGAQAFSGASLALGCFFLLCSKIVKMRKTGMGWRGKI